MSQIRPELINSDVTTPCMKDGTAYLMIYSAVKQKDGLVHGKLHDNGDSCAIGSYFDVNRATSLPTSLINEVAAVNDSVPHLTKAGRKRHVMKWLAWKLRSVGMGNFVSTAKAVAGHKKKVPA